MSGFDNRHDDDDDSIFFSRGTSSSDANGRILLIAIITLSVVVVVVTVLHVYARYVLRRQARRAAFHGIGIVARIHFDEPSSRGLEPTVIAGLPILMYKDIDHGLDRLEASPVECTVCLGVFEDSQMVRTLPNCNHYFHAECIDKWLGSKSSCPICRHEVELESDPTISPLPREPSTRLGVTGLGPPSAPPLERTVSSAVSVPSEGTSDETTQSLAKVNGANSRLSSFRRMISMDRSSRRVNSCTRYETEDLERQ